MSTGEALEAALAYATRGWQVFPCKPSGKTPATTHGFKDATTDPKQIRAWWRKHPNFNIGICTGAVSGLVVLDIDLDRGGDESLVRLTDRDWPFTILSKTGGGGAHCYFAHPGGLVKSRAALWPGIDVRGDGGYVIAPPSVHRNGQPYFWILPPLDPILFPKLLAAVPAWLSEKMRAVSTVPRRETTRQLRELEHTGVAFGMRNETLARLVGMWHFFKLPDDEIHQRAFAWNAKCRPPMEDWEVSKVVTSIMARADARQTPQDRIRAVILSRPRDRYGSREESLALALAEIAKAAKALTFPAPNAIIARYSTVRNKEAIRSGLKVLEEDGQITLAYPPSPHDPRLRVRVVTIIGTFAAVMQEVL